MLYILILLIELQ